MGICGLQPFLISVMPEMGEKKCPLLTAVITLEEI